MDNELNMPIEISKVLTQAWERTISQYEKGSIKLSNEKSLEDYFKKNCEDILDDNKLNTPVDRQKKFCGKIVDVLIYSEPRNAIELKIYHDPADWKMTKSMPNAVEKDLTFAKGDSRIWIGVIDTIPSTNKQKIPFDIDWKECNILEDVFEKNYKNINPPSSPPREKKQRWFFVNGSDL